MARLTTTDGRRSIEATLNNMEAAAACDRIPANHKDKSFASSIVSAFRRYGSQLTHNRHVWMHILAYQQIRREQPAPAPVATMQAALPAPKPVVAPIMGADEIAKAAAGQSLTMLMYDIPDAAEIANPSGRLRRIGIRLNKSVWLVPTGSVPHYLISELQNVGSSVITAPYDVNAAAGLLQAAITFANREMAEAVVLLGAGKVWGVVQGVRRSQSVPVTTRGIRGLETAPAATVLLQFTDGRDSWPGRGSGAELL